MATFQEIYNAAAARYPDGDWNRMAPSDITRAIDEEMHRRDAEGMPLGSTNSAISPKPQGQRQPASPFGARRLARLRAVRSGQSASDEDRRSAFDRADRAGGHRQHGRVPGVVLHEETHLPGLRSSLNFTANDLADECKRSPHRFGRSHGLVGAA